MIILSEIQLREVLTRFGGSPILENNLTENHKFSLSLFADPKRIANPRIEVTSQIDVTEIYKNYELHYKKTPGATFTAFLKWMLIKSMSATPFNWRHINHQWYQFNNLPLFVAIRTSDNRSLITSFLYNVTHSSWVEFCAKHSTLSQGQLAAEEPSLRDNIYSICYQIEGLHIPRMTSYRTTIKVEDSHRPSFIFSDRYIAEGRMYLPLHLSFSHATLMPKLAEEFLNKLITLAKKTPNEVQAEYELLIDRNSQTFLRRAKL